MKTVKDWKKRVDETLKEKANEVLKDFQAQRDKDLETLVQLSEQIHDFEVKVTVAKSLQEKESKQFIPNNKVLSEQAQKIQYCEKNIRAFQKQIDALFKRLTSYPESIREIYPFIKLIQG